MPGILLDTHALYWLVSGEGDLADEALFAIGESQETQNLFVSPITAWELALASQKRRPEGRPRLGADPPALWFRDAVRATAARLIPIGQRISVAAAQVVAETGHRDPGDCFLIASARMRKATLLTRDEVILSMAQERPGYLSVLRC